MNKNRLRLFLLLLLGLSYPFASFLWRHAYPFNTLEVVIIFLVMLTVAFALSVLLSAIRPLLACGVCALVTVLAMTVQFDLKFLALITLVAGVSALLFLIRERFVLLGIPIIAAMTVGAFFDARMDSELGPAAPSTSSGEAPRPPVIHIMLDSMIGVDGLPDHEQAAAIKNELTDFFKEFNFSVLSRSYSRYTHTGDSVYSAFNFTHGANSIYQWEALGRLEHVLQSNHYFDQFAGLGYRFSILQTEHIDFCQFNPDVVEICKTFLQPNARTVQAFEQVTDRVRTLANLLISQSTLLRDVGTGVFLSGKLGIAMHDPRVFGDLGRSIESAADGYVHFAHVLLPHGPYAYRGDCSLFYGNDALERYASEMGENAPSDALLDTRNGLFLEQVRCATQSLRELLRPLQANGILDRSLVIIHGDHGSTVARRMARKEFGDMLEPQDYRSHYSTLFALKFPGGRYQQLDNTISLGALFEHLNEAVAASKGGWNAGNEFDFYWRSHNLPLDDAYIYLSGTYPLLRVNLDIFQNEP